MYKLSQGYVFTLFGFYCNFTNYKEKKSSYFLDINLKHIFLYLKMIFNSFSINIFSEYDQDFCHTMMGYYFTLRVSKIHPCQCGSVSWALLHALKGCWFDNQSGHMPGWQALSLHGVCRRQLVNVYLSPSFFLSL